MRLDRSGAGRVLAVVAAVGAALTFGAVNARAETVMQQCGQQYQAAKTANTLNGQTWNQFRTECAARLKAGGAAPAAAPAPTPATPLKPALAEPPTPAPVVPAPTTTAAAPAAATPTMTSKGKPMSAGRAAFVTRERQCGSEWKANKVSLAAQTPGLTWPKYLSQCNTRLKAAGQ